MLSHLTNAPVEPKQQGSLSSLFMSVFSRSGDFPAVPQVQPPPHIGAESVTFYNVLESGVGSHQVKLTLSEGGLITERGKDKVVTRYGLTKIEWYAVDDTASEFLIQYHDLQADDKFQVAFRSHEYRTIYEHFCHYLSLKGDKLRNKQKEREQSGLVDALPVVEMAEGDVDTLAPHMPSPGSPLVLPAAPLHHHHYPSSGDHHHHHPLHHQQQHLHPHTGLHGSPSVGRSSPRVGSSSTTKKTSISSPRISFVAEPPVDKNKADASPAEGLLVVLPPPPRNRASTPVLKRAGATGPIGASPLGSASHSFEVLAVPSPGSPLVQPQQRPSTTHHDPAPSAPPFDLIDWH